MKLGKQSVLGVACVTALLACNKSRVDRDEVITALEAIIAELRSQ